MKESLKKMGTSTNDAVEGRQARLQPGKKLTLGNAYVGICRFVGRVHRENLAEFHKEGDRSQPLTAGRSSEGVEDPLMHVRKMSVYQVASIHWAAPESMFLEC